MFTVLGRASSVVPDIATSITQVATTPKRLRILSLPFLLFAIKSKSLPSPLVELHLEELEENEISSVFLCLIGLGRQVVFLCGVSEPRHTPAALCLILVAPLHQHRGKCFSLHLRLGRVSSGQVGSGRIRVNGIGMWVALGHAVERNCPKRLELMVHQSESETMERGGVGWDGIGILPWNYTVADRQQSAA